VDFSSKPLRLIYSANEPITDFLILQWAFAANEPRKVKVFGPLCYAWETVVVEGQRHIPAILETNHEARGEGLRAYTILSQESNVSSTIAGPVQPKKLYGKFDLFRPRVLFPREVMGLAERVYSRATVLMSSFL
jgi:hypothetical protein